MYVCSWKLFDAIITKSPMKIGGFLYIICSLGTILVIYLVSVIKNGNTFLLHISISVACKDDFMECLCMQCGVCRMDIRKKWRSVQCSEYINQNVKSQLQLSLSPSERSMTFRIAGLAPFTGFKQNYQCFTEMSRDG